MKKILITNTLILLIFSSCKIARYEKEIKGLWAIDTCIFKDENCLGNYLWDNLLVFKIENVAALPIMQDTFSTEERNIKDLSQIENYQNYKVDGYAKWYLKDSLDELYINIVNDRHLLGGEYKVTLIYNERRNLQHMVLKNELIELKMTKALANWN